MALGEVLARLSVVLGLDTAAFEAGATAAEKRMAQSQRKFEALGKKFGDIGKSLTIGLTAPLVAFGVTAVRAAQESAEALGQVEAALQSMGDASGRTSEQLQALATGQMTKSLYDDDDILRKVTANLLTFGNVAGTVFDRAQQAALDLSARMGTDLQASALQIGKALNDPIKGLTSLTRIGITFTDQQKEQVKAMAAAGNAAGAQAVILGELERQFGGSAAAMRAANPAAALQQSFAELQETIGQKILPLLQPFIEKANQLLTSFSNLSPATQNLAIGLGIAAAALGPLMVLFGGLTTLAAPILAFVTYMGGLIATAGSLSAALPILGAAVSSLLASFVAVALPVAAVAAAGYLIYKNWDKIGPVFEALGARFNEVLGPKVQALVSTITTKFTELWNGPLGNGIRKVMDVLLAFGTIYTAVLGEGLIRVLGAAVELLTGAFSIIADAIDLVVSLLTGDWAGAWDAASSIVMTMGRTVLNVLNALLPGAVAALQGIYEGARDWLGQKFGSVMDFVLDKIRAVEGAFAWMYDRVVGNSHVPDMVDEIAAEMGRLDAVMVRPVTTATRAAEERFKEMAQNTRSLLDRLFPDAAAQMTYQAERAVLDTMADGSTRDAARRALANERDTARNAAREAGRPDIDFGVEPLVVETDKVQGALERLAERSKVTTVRIADSFKDMADKTLSALSNMTQSIKGGGFLDILQSVIGLGLQLGSIGAFGKGIASKINTAPRYANGTNFSRGGWAIVGERGPEMVNLQRGSQVIPNNQVGSGGNTYNISGNLLTPEFWAQIQNGHVAAAEAGASGAQARMAFANSRRLE